MHIRMYIFAYTYIHTYRIKNVLHSCMLYRVICTIVVLIHCLQPSNIIMSVRDDVYVNDTWLVFRSSVCMYVCMYVCVCVYVCICVCMYV